MHVRLLEVRSCYFLVRGLNVTKVSVVKIENIKWLFFSF